MVENWDNKKDSKLEYEIRKVHGIMGEISYSIVFPKKLCVGYWNMVKEILKSRVILKESS